MDEQQMTNRDTRILMVAQKVLAIYQRLRDVAEKHDAAWKVNDDLGQERHKIGIELAMAKQELELAATYQEPAS